MIEEKKVDEFEIKRAKRKIRNVRFRPISLKRELDPNLIGYASFIYDDNYLYESITVRKFGNTYRITLPYREQKATGKTFPFLTALNFEIREAQDAAIIQEVEEFLANNQLNFEV